MPAGIRKDRGLILHVPMNGTATLYDVDISGVGAWVDAAIMARRINGEAPLRAHVVGTVDLRAGAYQPPAVSAIDPETAQKLQDSIQSAREQLSLNVSLPVHTPEEITQAVTTAAREARAEQELVGGTGKPLAPLAEAGKKGCSVCRRTGHRKGSPVCLGEKDPALDTPDPMTPAEDEFSSPAPEPTGTDPALSKIFNGQGTAGVDFPHAPRCLLDPERWPHTTCPNPGDRCSCVSPTGWVTRSDGKFVHGVCGLLSVPPPTKLETPLAAPEPKLSDPTPTVAPSTPPTSSWPSAPAGDWVLEDMKTARTSAAVLAVRENAIQRGAWVEDTHAAPGYTRWNELQMEGK
jgi:hypothetical protein